MWWAGNHAGAARTCKAGSPSDDPGCPELQVEAYVQSLRHLRQARGAPSHPTATGGLTGDDICGIISSEWPDNRGPRSVPRQDTALHGLSSPHPFNFFLPNETIFHSSAVAKSVVHRPPLYAPSPGRTPGAAHCAGAHPLDKARPLWHISPCCCHSSTAKTAYIPHRLQRTRQCNQAAGRS